MLQTTRFVLPALALVGAAVVVAPGTAEGWVLSGWSLNLNERSFRVLNNFTDPTANSNTVPDPNFPGATGATLALWKACIEWSSALHGDGGGDPTQPGGLGSGGANFDPSYQGAAFNAGNIGDNIISELPGCSGGVLAFTTSFTNGSGWRMEFYACHTWYALPGTNFPSGGGRFDLQGVATHEYGHATGLDHTGIGGATMFPSTADGKTERSIELDDIGGIRANYGVASATKPRITGLSWNGTQLTINGANFAATGNRVWFTRSGFGLHAPLEVTGLASSNGNTRILVNPPAAAGSGDVLVRTSASTLGAVLSQPYPWDINNVQCPPPFRYCAQVPSPLGQMARIDIAGSQSVATNNFALVCSDVQAGQFGLFFYGPFASSVPAGDGILCIASPLYRQPAVQVDSLGIATYLLDLTAPTLPGGQILPGQTWNFSFWFRQFSPAGYNFSDALAVTFCD